MHWNTWGEFFAMGGYAFYVWTSFGLTVLFILWEIYFVRQRWLIGAHNLLWAHSSSGKNNP